MAVLLNQTNITNPLINGTTYILTENVTVTVPLTFGGSGAGIVFDGSGHTVTVTGNGSWNGLFSVDISAQNLIVDSSGSALYSNISSSEGAGWIFGKNSGGTASYCSSSGSIPTYCGGIFGSGSTGTANYCFNTGTLGAATGGIFGITSTGTANNCFNTGTFSGIESGGIFGTSSTGTANFCYNTGGIRTKCGGIFGANCGGTANNCYNTGSFTQNTMYDDGGGGIYGYQSSGSAVACYNTAAITRYSGGIFNTGSTGNATNCYNTGSVGGYAGGICGYQTTGTATNCYNGSSINVQLAGGIYGYPRQSDSGPSSGSSPSWADASANLYLTGFPGDTNPQVWYSQSANTSYVLSPSIAVDLAYITDSRLILTWNVNVPPLPYQIFVTLSPPGGTIVYDGSPVHGSAVISDLSYNIPYTASLVDVNGTPVNGVTHPVVSQFNDGNTITLIPTTTTTTTTLAPVSVTQSFINANTPLSNGVSYILTEDVTMTIPFPFSGNGAGIVFNGNNHTITVVNSADCYAVFSNGITVRNLGVDSSGSTLHIQEGWFFSDNASGGSATNCYSTGAVSLYGGGIFGSRINSGTAINCYSTGYIGVQAGGIFGASSSGLIATNCYTTGLLASGAGSIFGGSSTGTISNSGHTNGWFDSSANVFLTGTPGSGGSQVWYSAGSNIPYLLAPPPPPTTTTTTQSIYFSIADLGDTFIVVHASSTINIYTATVQPTARLTQDISTNTITCYGLSPGTQYTVSAYVPGDPVAKTITATTLGTTTTTTTTTTHAPSQFTVIATSVPSGIGTVRIDWDYVPSAFKYVVSDRTNPPEIITSLIQTVTFRNLVPGSVYIFMVTALAQNGSTILVGYSAPFTVPGL